VFNSYNPYNGNITSGLASYYPNTYLPIDWIYTTYFYNNTSISEITLNTYSTDPNASSPKRDFYRYEGKRSDWKAQGTMPY